MEPEVRFKIIPGAVRQVTRKETVPASLYFEIPDVAAKDCEASCTSLTIRFRPSMRHEHPEKYNRETSVLVLTRFGLFTADDKLNLQAMIDDHGGPCIQTAFRNLAFELQRKPYPVGSIDLMTRMPLAAEHKPAIFHLEAETVREITETVVDQADIYFDVDGATIPRDNDIVVIGCGLNIAACRKFSPYYEGMKGTLYLNHLGYLSESPDMTIGPKDKAGFESSISRLVNDHPSERIEALFRELGEKLLQTVKPPPTDANVWRPLPRTGKPPPTDAKVWRQIRVTEIKLVKSE